MGRAEPEIHGWTNLSPRSAGNSSWPFLSALDNSEACGDPLDWRLEMWNGARFAFYATLSLHLFRRRSQQRLGSRARISYSVTEFPSGPRASITLPFPYDRASEHRARACGCRHRPGRRGETLIEARQWWSGGHVPRLPHRAVGGDPRLTDGVMRSWGRVNGRSEFRE